MEVAFGEEKEAELKLFFGLSPVRHPQQITLTVPNRIVQTRIIHEALQLAFISLHYKHDGMIGFSASGVCLFAIIFFSGVPSLIDSCGIYLREMCAQISREEKERKDETDACVFVYLILSAILMRSRIIIHSLSDVLRRLNVKNLERNVHGDNRRRFPSANLRCRLSSLTSSGMRTRRPRIALHANFVSFVC